MDEQTLPQMKRRIGRFIETIQAKKSDQPAYKRNIRNNSGRTRMIGRADVNIIPGFQKKIFSVDDARSAS
jgi:hypothetical protein